jgi:hypothetical protein
MRDRLWSVQEGGQDDVGEVPADTREMMTLKNRCSSSGVRYFGSLGIDLLYLSTYFFVGKQLRVFSDSKYVKVRIMIIITPKKAIVQLRTAGIS